MATPENPFRQSAGAAVARPVLERAAELHAASASLKLPDAIHAATAILSGGTSFLTNDARFQKVAGLHAVLLSELTTS